MTHLWQYFCFYYHRAISPPAQIIDCLQPLPNLNLKYYIVIPDTPISMSDHFETICLEIEVEIYDLDLIWPLVWKYLPKVSRFGRFDWWVLNIVCLSGWWSWIYSRISYYSRVHFHHPKSLYSLVNSHMHNWLFPST